MIVIEGRKALVNRLVAHCVLNRYYGKPCGQIRLKRGNMLEDAETIQYIQKADVILVNK